MIRITDPADPRIGDYCNVPDPELLRDRGLFVAENRLVVRTLLASRRFRTRSVLVTDAAYDSLRDVLEEYEARADGQIYVCAKALMEPVSGHNIHRGCLALGERPAPIAAQELLASLPGARLVVALEALTNADNVGGIFRSARAFGVDAILMGPRCCDPLYRKAIRVSIGAALEVPFATAEAPGEATSGIDALKGAGFTTVALTPAVDAVDLDDYARGPRPTRMALLVGNEGDGLSAATLAAADVRVRIAMVPGVDSLNVATATAIALQRMWR